MEGPTPVSALIHAATLVTLGVILFLRLPTIPSSLLITILCILLSITVSLLGIGICLDLKRSIAYSTITQMTFPYYSPSPITTTSATCTSPFMRSTSLLVSSFGILQHITYRQDVRHGIYRTLSGITHILSLCTLYIISVIIIIASSSLRVIESVSPSACKSPNHAVQNRSSSKPKWQVRPPNNSVTAIG